MADMEKVVQHVAPFEDHRDKESQSFSEETEDLSGLGALAGAHKFHHPFMKKLLSWGVEARGAPSFSSSTDWCRFVILTIY